MAAPLPAKSISDRRTARETGLSDGQRQREWIGVADYAVLNAGL